MSDRLSACAAAVLINTFLYRLVFWHSLHESISLYRSAIIKALEKIREPCLNNIKLKLCGQWQLYDQVIVSDSGMPRPLHRSTISRFGLCTRLY